MAGFLTPTESRNERLTTNPEKEMNERRKPLSCACCGSDAGKWKQFSNQDAGWGLCRKCADMLTDDSTGRPRMSHAELRRVYGVPGVNFEAQNVKTCGRTFDVLADFPDTEAGTAEANAYMEAYEGAALLLVRAGRAYLADKADKGV